MADECFSKKPEYLSKVKQCISDYYMLENNLIENCISKNESRYFQTISDRKKLKKYHQNCLLMKNKLDSADRIKNILTSS